MHRDKRGEMSSSPFRGDVSTFFPPRVTIPDFLLQSCASCLPFPSGTTQKGGFGETESVHIAEYRSLLQGRNHRAYQESRVPLMSAIPSLLKYEINEVEFNFRVYKLVMCSSFLLPFYMAGWGWQTCFVRRAALEFWFNEALSSSHFPPLISTSRDEKDMPLLLEVFTTGNVHLWLSWRQALGNFLSWTSDWLPAEGALPQCPHPRALSPLSGWLLFPPGWIGRASGGSEVGSQEERRWRLF